MSGPFGDLDAADVVALHALIARYGHVMDAKAWDRLGDVFATDAVLDMSHQGLWVAEGLDEIRQRFPLLDHPRGHHTTNLVVEPGAGPDGVAMRSKYMAVRETGAISLGTYLDEAARRDGRWRLTRRTMVPRRR